MAQRRFEKRLRQVVLGVGALYGLATLVAPQHDAPGRSEPQRSATFPSLLQWRPAGQVLRRKPSDALARLRYPWAPDTVVSVPRAALTRWHSIYTYARRFAISAELAGKVHDNAVRQGIEPELAFRLVQVESEFKPRAASPVGAIGLTQLMLGTARELEPGVTREALMEPETNLRIGFRYLRTLIRENKGNLSLALLVYNRGPVAVQAALDMGRDPANGYDLAVIRGYRGRGTLD